MHCLRAFFVRETASDHFGPQMIRAPRGGVPRASHPPNRKETIMRNLSALILAAAALTGVLAAATTASTTHRQTSQANIVQLAASSPQLTTLVSLVKKAGLVAALSNPKAQLTVFAPTNAAFAKLKKAAPKTFAAVATTPALLKKILTYHVLPAKVDAMAATAAAKKGASVKTLEGEKIKLSIVGGKLTLNGSSTVIKADLAASNGVVHLINTVLVPPSVKVNG
jgi:transforming growth factor-beta-induced protein